MIASMNVFPIFIGLSIVIEYKDILLAVDNTLSVVSLLCKNVKSDIQGDRILTMAFTYWKRNTHSN